MISGSMLRGAGAYYLGDRATGACPLHRQRGSGGAVERQPSRAQAG